MIAVLVATSAAARTIESATTPELSAAASGEITGRILVEPTGGGSFIGANAGFVRLYSAFAFLAGAVATASLTSSGFFEIASVPAGSYLVEIVSTDARALPVREWYNDARSIFNAETVTITDGVPLMFGNIRLEERRIDTERLSGTNRFGTAAAVSSRCAGDGADRNIVIVNGLNFPDALAADPLASRTSAPILMVTQNSIPPETRAELERLNPLTITIVGGTGVVSSAVQSQLEQLVADPTDVIRLAGENRYDTSRALVRAMQADAPITELFVATRLNFPDALAAVPVAGRVGGAVLLVDGSASSLDQESATLINDLGVPVTLVGGPMVVSDGIRASIESLGLSVNRVAGSDRFSTAIALAITYFPIADLAYVANGFGFADALAVGSFGGNFGIPVYLSRGDCLPQAVVDDLIDGLFNRVILAGGTGVLSSAVESLKPCAA